MLALLPSLDGEFPFRVFPTSEYPIPFLILYFRYRK